MFCVETQLGIIKDFNGAIESESWFEDAAGWKIDPLGFGFVVATVGDFKFVLESVEAEGGQLEVQSEIGAILVFAGADCLGASKGADCEGWWTGMFDIKCAGLFGI